MEYSVMNKQAVVTIDGRQVVIENEQNLLELIRKADIDLVTFCYHSELSVYGACRLCFVEVEGRGIQPACSTAPAAGMKIRTHTEELREMRRVTLELLLANHDQSCPTCARSTSCQLQKLARRLGIEKVRYKRTHQQKPVDRSSWSLVRDPNKCVLCGDCVRMCSFRRSERLILPCAGECLGSALLWQGSGGGGMRLLRS